MSKFIRIYMSESDYDLLSRVAKSAGKGISSFAREMLLSAIKQDIKQVSLLNKLISKIESLNESSELSQSKNIFELAEEQKKFFITLYVLNRNALIQLMQDELKKEALLKIIDDFERNNFGATVYEIFNIKKS